MDNLAEFTSVLKSLKESSALLIKNLLPIMNEITEKNNDLVGEIEYRTECDKKDITKWLEEKTILLSEDAEKIVKEVDKFAENYTKGPEVLEKNSKEYPFLAEVWFGDIYNGKEELEALKLLLKDIEKDLKEVDDDHLIKVCAKHFSSQKKKEEK